MVGLSTNNINGLVSCLMFLIIYIIMNIIFFTVILNSRHFISNYQILFLNDLYSVQSKNLNANYL